MLHTYALAIFAVAVASGLVPLFVRRSDRLLHVFIAFATGIFLGVVFLHLLPELGRMAARPGRDAPGGTPDLWLLVLVGVVVLFLLENLLVRGGGSGHTSHGDTSHGEHAVVGYAVLFGLTVHGFTAGLGLAAAAARPGLASPVFLSILSHKGVEGFSLTTVFLLAGFRLRKILALTACFALVTPAGVLLGRLLREQLDAFGLEAMMALAAGTFLFVALVDLLPEVFHRRIDTAWKVAFLAAGVAVSLAIHR